VKKNCKRTLPLPEGRRLRATSEKKNSNAPM
jgi:hypothetical protein